MILINAIGTRQAVERVLAKKPVDIYLAAIDPRNKRGRIHSARARRRRRQSIRRSIKP